MSLPPFPKKLEGTIFTEIMPQFLKEVNPKKLVELGAIIIKKKKKLMYEPLTDSLRKIQWVKLVSSKAISIESEIENEMDSNNLIMDPIGQTAHSLCVTDCLIHTKSALDSMAVFLTNLLELRARGGDRDFKKVRFRVEIMKKESNLGSKINKFNYWFKELQDIRDEWIHRSSIRSRIIQGKNEVGILPIPKNVTLNFEKQMELPITKDSFISTNNFANYHYSNLVSLFNIIIDGAIEIEKRNLKGTIPIPSDVEKQLTLFPTRAIKDMKPDGIKVKFHKSLSDW
ncbi:MAG: hypothetical protein KAW45_00795 [Thermoplasmatales archaeon]|nr:hypothetical protein [Thermoplasmatales archaeon]